MRPLDRLPRPVRDVAHRAASLALSIVRHVAELVRRRASGDDAPPPQAAREAPVRPASAPPARQPAAAPPPVPPPAASPAPGPPPSTPPAAAPPPPAHVDRGPVVVAESADAGAEDGAGAEVNVGEPWDGYSALTAKEITAQLATASTATLAVVRLYESAHRNRRTVIAAVDRRLAAADR
jgi:hypothetical protein